MAWRLLHECCLLSCFIYCDINEKCVQYVMIYDAVIYSNSIAFLLWFTDVTAISSNSVMVLINDGLSCFILLCWHCCNKWMMQFVRYVVMKINYNHCLSFVIWYLCCFTCWMPYLSFLPSKTWFRQPSFEHLGWDFIRSMDVAGQGKAYLGRCSGRSRWLGVDSVTPCFWPHGI